MQTVKKKSKVLYPELLNVLVSVDTKKRVISCAEKREIALTAFIREAIAEKLERVEAMNAANKKTRRAE